MRNIRALLWGQVLCGLVLALVVSAAFGQGNAANRVVIDASKPGAAAVSLAGGLGTGRNPSGKVLSANSQYLTMDGKPWLPVMGELHYSRLPEAEWEQAILQMKAGGVEIISTYVIWIHHEQAEGIFDWKSNKDLRHFAELCAKHGMYLYPRIGPWAHAEVRNGGLPDWVIAKGKTRQNDPAYLKAVGSLYQQIGQQLRGLWWKDGGPVVGIQLENEYRGSGPGQGAEHIRMLKQIALANGMDVPVYTVTGWDGAAIPLDATLPVYGGYPDAPWDGSSVKLPAADVYAFRFDNRASGSMGAIGGAGQSAADVYAGTPFLTAEVGAGIQDTYFRRPVVSSDDIAAVVPVMLGSGANLMGYYMFHGGRNPDGGAITLQESQRTGYPTDVPVKSYDFQAPIDNNGEEQESFRRLKLVHYFLNDFGSLLAPMAAHAPETVPASATDLSVPRVSARSEGDRAFVFLNNYVRGAEMPARPGFSVVLKLPEGTVQVPREQIELPSGAYGIWPVNFALGGGGRLSYSTAQLFKQLTRAGEAYILFFAIPGITPEFLLDETTILPSTVGFSQQVVGRSTLLRASSSSLLTESRIDLRTAAGVTHLLLLSRERAEQVWKMDDPGELVLSRAQFFADGQTIQLRSDGEPTFAFGVLGGVPVGSDLRASGKDGIFSAYRASVPVVAVQARVTKIKNKSITKRTGWPMGPAFAWRKEPIAMAPQETEFAAAARWTIAVTPDHPIGALVDTLLRVRYQGDVARLEANGQLLDDDFWSGRGWTIGLREIPAYGTYTLSVLPLPEKYPMYLERGQELRFSAGQAGELSNVEVVPQYGLTVKLRPAP